MLSIRSRQHVKDARTVYNQYMHREVGLPDEWQDVYMNSYEIPYKDLEEYIAYDPQQVGRQREWKTFEHYKARYVDHPLPADARSYWDPWVTDGIPWIEVPVEHPWHGYRGEYWATTATLTPLYVSRDDGGFIPEPLDLEQLVVRSLRSMLPLVKSELSILNSLYELKDFKTMPRTFAKVLAVFRDILPSQKARLIRSSRAAADVYLQEEFNIKPMQSDIEDICVLLSRTQGRINDLMSRAGRTQVKHFSYTWQELPDNSKVTSTISGTGVFGWHSFWQTGTFNAGRRSNVRNDWEVRCAPTRFHAMMQYNYQYSHLQAEYAQLLGFLDAFGVNLNLAIIWNAIPWSFVVDWLIGVSRWLNSFKVSLLEPQINVLQYLWSIRRERQISMRTHFEAKCGSYVIPGATEQSIRRPTLTQTAYRRQVGLPDASSFTTSGLSLKEFSLGAALAISYRKGRKRVHRSSR